MAEENFTWEVPEDPEDWEDEIVETSGENSPSRPRKTTRREFLQQLKHVGLGAAVGFFGGKISSTDSGDKRKPDEVVEERKSNQSFEPVASLAEVDFSAVNKVQSLLAGTTNSMLFSDKVSLVYKSEDSDETWKSQAVVRGRDPKTGEDKMGVVFDSGHYPNKSLIALDARLSPDGKKVFLDALNVAADLETQTGALPVVSTDTANAGIYNYGNEKLILERPQGPDDRPIVRKLAPEAQVIFGKDSAEHILSYETTLNPEGAILLTPTVRTPKFEKSRYFSNTEDIGSKVNEIAKKNLFGEEGWRLTGTRLGFRMYETGCALSENDQVLAWDCRKVYSVEKDGIKKWTKQNTVEICFLTEEEKQNLTVSPFENKILHGEIERHDVLGITKNDHFILTCVEDKKVVALSFVKPNDNEEYGYETRVLKLSDPQDSLDVVQTEKGVVGKKGKVLLSYDQMDDLTQQEAGRAYRIEKTGFVEE